MKKILLTILFLIILMTSSCSPDDSKNEQRINIDQYNITQHFEINNGMYGDASTLKPCVTLYDLDSDSYVGEISIVMTIEYEVSYYCNRYLSSCEEFNTTKFEANFSIAEDGRLTPLIQNKINRDSLSNVCSHGINHDTVKIVNYRIVTASGYYVKIVW